MQRYVKEKLKILTHKTVKKRGIYKTLYLIRKWSLFLET